MSGVNPTEGSQPDWDWGALNSKYATEKEDIESTKTTELFLGDDGKFSREKAMSVAKNALDVHADIVENSPNNLNVVKLKKNICINLRVIADVAIRSIEMHDAAGDAIPAQATGTLDPTTPDTTKITVTEPGGTEKHLTLHHLKQHFKDDNHYGPNVKLNMTLNGITYVVMGGGGRDDGSLKLTGTFGRVFLGRQVGGSDDGRKVAVKFAKPPLHSPYSTKIEAKILKRVYGQENIVGAFHAEVDDSNKMIAVMDQLDRPVELFDAILDSSLDTMEKTYKVLKDGAHGLARLHALGIVHRDIKPENFVLERDGDGALNTVDFGFARSLEADDDTYTSTGTTKTVLLKKREGTPAYLAPEVIEKKEQTKETDVFSYGLTMFSAITQSMTHDMCDRMSELATCSEEPKERINRDGLTDDEIQSLKYIGVDAGIIEIIHKAVRNNPDDRPSMDEIETALTASLEKLKG